MNDKSFVFGFLFFMDSKISIICAVCKKAFKVIPYRKDKAKFCSIACGAKSRNTIIIRGGEKYNKLTIVKEVAPEIQFCRGNPTKLRRVYCICDCGGSITTRLVMVINGDAKSCGCFKKEQDISNLKLGRGRKFGFSATGFGSHVLYSRWSNMMSRCYDEKCEHYHRYGGRGITVCEKWHNIKNFICDMYPSFIIGLEIERVDNDGNYELNNCIWGTKEIQSNNKRSTVRVEYEGEIYPLGIISKKLMVDRSKIRTLMIHYNIPFTDALKKYDDKRNYTRSKS